MWIAVPKRVADSENLVPGRVPDFSNNLSARKNLLVSAPEILIQNLSDGSQICRNASKFEEENGEYNASFSADGVGGFDPRPHAKVLVFFLTCVVLFLIIAGIGRQQERGKERIP